jgi:hypothetical protein
MNLTVVYYDRVTNEQHVIEIPNDVVEIRVPDSVENGLPALRVNVNTDAVIVDRLEDGAKIAMYEFTDLYADAIGDIGEL